MSVLLASQAPLVGISSLAIGADQVFAELLLRQGGDLWAVLPFEGYEETFSPGKDREIYFGLLMHSARIETLPRLPRKEESYLLAGYRVVDLSDRLIAVWNGKKAAGLGGTGDVVDYARVSGKEILHIDPVTRQILEIQGRDEATSRSTG